MEKINEPKSWFFEKIKTQKKIIKFFRNERGAVSTDTTNTKDPKKLL